MRILVFIAIILVLILTNIAFADYKADKSECERLSRGYFALANLRDQYEKDEIYDEVLKAAVNNNYTTEHTMAVLYGVLYVHAHPELTKEQIKKKAYVDCMELAGHDEV